VIFAYPFDMPIFCRGILAGGGIKTASFLLFASCGAERFSAPLFEAISSGARGSGRWAESDGMPGFHVPCITCRMTGGVSGGSGRWGEFDVMPGPHSPCSTRRMMGGVSGGSGRWVEFDALPDAHVPLSTCRMTGGVSGGAGRWGRLDGMPVSASAMASGASALH
jgi:hypothetical protein